MTNEACKVLMSLQQRGYDFKIIESGLFIASPVDGVVAPEIMVLVSRYQAEILSILYNAMVEKDYSTVH